MSHGEEQSALLEDVTSRPSFEAALRGYDKRQVDQYVSQTTGEISTLAAERERAFIHIHGLAAQLEQLQAEVTELRQRPPQVDRASFRHLGSMVDQILALAEKQAGAITETAAQRVAGHQADAEKALVEAREQAHKLRADSVGARARAEQEAKRINEQSAQQAEEARAAAEALVEAARAQVQQEVEAVRAQTLQELAQWKATAEQEIGEVRAAADRDAAERRAVAEQKSAALHAEAQRYSVDLRRRAGEHAAANQQQLAAVQKEIEAGQQVLAQMHAELAAAEQRLAQAREEGATVESEVVLLQQRLGEVRGVLAGEFARLDEAKQAATAAEQHARDVRARVQREAKRVADLAAAAVMAAAAGGADTGEYRMVPVRSAADRAADEATAPDGDKAAPDGDKALSEGDTAAPEGDRAAPEGEKAAAEGEKAATEGEKAAPESDRAVPDGDRTAPAPEAPTGDVRARHGVDTAAPEQRAPEPQKVAADTE